MNFQRCIDEIKGPRQAPWIGSLASGVLGSECEHEDVKVLSSS